jgi:hypothetical protein
MPRFVTLTLFFLIILTNKTHSQDFGTLTSQIFFNADIKSKDTTLISYFTSRPELTLIKETGWTAYSPTDDKGNLIPFEIFSFSEHPYFASSSKNGRLMVMTTKESDKIIGMSLSLNFNSAQVFDMTYKNIKRLYTRYASKTIKRPNIAQPFEVTKYLSKDGSDFVIITKGEDDNRPYVHIAYNYQGYDW